MPHSIFDAPRRRGPATLPACAATEQHAYELLDGAIDVVDADALRAHLAHCAACRARVASARRFLAAIHRQRLRQPAAPEALRRRARALLAAETDPAADSAAATEAAPDPAPATPVVPNADPR